MNGSPKARSTREWALAAAFYAGVTVLMTWPQAIRLGDGASDLWDAKLSAWILHWDYAQTLRDPLNLFQAPILHPFRYVLAFSENLYGAAVFGFPLLASGASLIVNYNVNLLLAMFLSALSAWALARYVTGDALASLAAGLIYAFLPYKLAQLPHLHMEWGAFLCLVFLYLLRYLDGGRRRDAVLLAVVFAWGVLACLQYAFFTLFLIAVVLVLEAVRGGPERWRRIRGAVLAMALGGLACLPFLIPYVKASALYGMRRTIGEMTYFSAKPWYFLSAGSNNRLYGALTARWRGPEGDFFPGLAALILAVYAVSRLRRAPVPDSVPPAMAAARHLAARAFDATAAILAALAIWAWVSPGLRLGPLSVGDPGRVVVWLTIAVLARLSLAFPRKSRYRSLADFLRRQPLEGRVVVLLLIAAVGIVVCFGGHTPYYPFLVQSLGSLFRAVRALARGVVLFQVALAVLAAWGLSLWTRGLPKRRRLLRVALVLGLLAFEYRAFPLRLWDIEASPRPVDGWLRAADFRGAVVEWPLGFPQDCDYTLRQAEHRKLLVNGHESFAPQPYAQLQDLLRLRPIPDDLFDRVAALDATVLVFHPHEAAPGQAGAYRNLVGRGVRQRRLELLGCVPDGPHDDFVFRLAGAPPVAPGFSAEAQADARVRLEAFLSKPEGEVAPPFGVIQVPAEGASVAAGSWGFGWALDDSGMAEIRIGTELGPAGIAQLGGRWPGLPEAYPDFSEAPRGGYGFEVPDVPPGPHTLRVTLVGQDGGLTTLERAITVLAAPRAAPKPKGPRKPV